MSATDLDFRIFDCDNHYYEAPDAFTRHLDPAFRKRGMQWAEIDGRKRLLVGGKINRFIPNPTWDPISKPGALDEYFRGRNPKGADTPAALRRPRPAGRPSGVPESRRPAGGHGQAGPRRGPYSCPPSASAWSRPCWRDVAGPDGRLPGLQSMAGGGLGLRLPGAHLRRPVHDAGRSENAASELQWALDHDARFIVMVGGPVVANGVGRSPADPDLRPLLVARQRVGGDRLLPRRRQRLFEVSRRLGRELGDGGVSPEPLPGPGLGQCPSRTTSPTCSLMGISPATPTCGWRPSRRGRPGCSTCSRS